METHPIRREYLNPAIIPPTEDGPACWRWYAVVEFDVEQLTPGLFGSLYDNETLGRADAVLMSRRRLATPEERAQMERDGKPGLFVGPTYYRVIAYRGKPITTGEYTDSLAALRDAIQQREPTPRPEL